MNKDQKIKLITKNPRDIMGFDNNLFEIGSNVELTILNPKIEWIFNYNNIVYFIYLSFFY